MCIEDFEKDSEKYIERMEKAKESKGHEGHKRTTTSMVIKSKPKRHL